MRYVLCAPTVRDFFFGGGGGGVSVYFTVYRILYKVLTGDDPCLDIQRCTLNI